jgi:hypothetical protein
MAREWASKALRGEKTPLKSDKEREALARLKKHLIYCKARKNEQSGTSR